MTDISSINKAFIIIIIIIIITTNPNTSMGWRPFATTSPIQPICSDQIGDGLHRRNRVPDHTTVSSTNNLIFEVISLPISLTNNKKHKGPNTIPRGTPDLTVLALKELEYYGILV